MMNFSRDLIPLLPAMIGMALVILISNILVQIPIDHSVRIAGRSFNLAELLTWGAITYPVAFLVTDTTNRLFGKQAARRVVYVGFALGVVLSLIAAFGIAGEAAARQDIALLSALISDADARAMLRIALASGSAFLIGQLLDITIFDQLRAAAWWKAPSVSSLFGSATDTAVFFSLAFAGSGLPWINWAIGDFCVKLLMVALLLYPFRLIIGLVPARLKTAGP